MKNRKKAHAINAEDSLISRMILSFLFTPLIVLMLAGTVIAA